MFNLVVLGSITEDIIITPQERKQFIGGVPVYAAAVAKALGEPIEIVSKVGTDFHLKNLKLLNSFGVDLDGFKITGKSSMKFENKYNEKGHRSQKILSFSDKISFEDIPESYFQAPCIHLGPVYNEIDLELIKQVRKRFELVSLDGQGFTRSLKKGSKEIIIKPWMKYEEYLPLIDILKVDDAELKGLTGSTTMKEATARALSSGIKFLIITRAHKGAIIYHKTKRYDISPVPTTIVDETGAGDTFITAFLLEYLRTKDCHYSAMVAASTAAFKIANSGPIPNYSRADILAKLKTIYPNFIEQ